MSRLFRWLCLALLVGLYSCSSQRFVPEGSSILSKVSVSSDSKSVDAVTYSAYVRQRANTRWFNVAKVPLGIFCLSGTDTTRSINRFFQRLGEAPVIYDSALVRRTRNNMCSGLISRGYLDATVSADVTTDHRNKTRVNYRLSPGALYRIGTIDRRVDDPIIDSLINGHNDGTLLRSGQPCDIGQLDRERERIVNILHREGYYRVLKNFISYDLDTTREKGVVDVTLNFEGQTVARDSVGVYDRYHIRNIQIDVNLEQAASTACDSIDYRGMQMRFHGSRMFRPHVLYEQMRLQPGQLYDEDGVQTSYRNFSNLQALRYAIIRLEEADSACLDVRVTLQPNKRNALSAELEGTNTSGDLGVASSVTYSNRNLFRGSEVWTTKVKAAFEAITGLEGYNDKNFFEIFTESRLSFPCILLPFQVHNSRLRSRGTSELAIQYNMQERPEFHRRVVTGAWSYRWRTQRNKMEHKLDVLSLSYVFMPWISNTFRKEYLEDTDNKTMAIVRYSYENLFIENAAYSFVLNSAGLTGKGGLFQKNAYQLKLNVETAGNLLYAFARATRATRDASGAYNMFNIAFAQYAKLDLDYARSFVIDSHNSFALHGAFGIAQPYGNASIVPFEKRYFAGGPNSVRGWSVRGLGPGRYIGKDGRIDYINQTGNMKLLFNMELRSDLFWKLGGALFVDAGNVWNTRHYAAQSGGEFQFDKFLKQIAVSYGIGMRLNLDYFILRFDWGMRAINPAYQEGDERYPLLHPRIGRDLTFHFAVGLPF